MQGITANSLPTFGENLFQGNFGNTYHDGLSPDYIIMPGDRILTRIWGQKTYDDVTIVDTQGNIFLPEIGPVRVAGVNQGQLLNTIKEKIASVFTNGIEVYVNLLNTQSVAVYVTGCVNKPGRYAGGPNDSVFYYLDRAGGIDTDYGSFRDITLLRNNTPIGQIDLYPFLTRGTLQAPRLKDGDVILVGKKGMSVAIFGLVRQPAIYEFKAPFITGKDIYDLVFPLNNVSHISVSGTRNGAPFNTYIANDSFPKFRLQDNDSVEFHADKPGYTIMVGVAGAITGPSRYPVLSGATLKALLSYVAIDPSLANLQGIYVKRRSVAEQQKRVITDALRRLENSALTATSSTVDEANIRVREAELIQDFVKRASSYEPDGVVVVCSRNQLNNIILEDGDIIVIPQKSDVIQVSGEVRMPKSIVYNKSMEVRDYIAGSGGYSDRADTSGILIIRPNGEVAKADSIELLPGDNLLVMPKFDTKNMQLFKDLTDVLYKIAIATKVALTL
ncbi:MAG: SLBB domain-containing protein [Deltaproteobacteria bacterium]|nr:SLBB domain-containing protein [Deltaproteobacteria bacterium]